MNLGKVRIAYPHVEYEIKITHHTERKSTAMEWLLLEIAQKVEEYPNYSAIPLNDILKNLFCISDGDILLRQVLLDLIDVNALEYIQGFTDRSDWNQLRCGDLRLTEVGRNLQREGRLPAKTQDNIISAIYDIVNDRLIDKNKRVLSDDTNNPKVKDISPDNLVFPEALVRAWLLNHEYPWLQQNSRIDFIEPVENQIKWQNVVKDIFADNDGNLSLNGEFDSEVVEAVLREANFGEMPDYELPILTVSDLSTKKKYPYAKGVENLFSLAAKSKVFFIAPQFADVISSLKEKICLVFGQPVFAIEQDGTNMIVKIPQNIGNGLCYQDDQCAFSAAAIKLQFGNIVRFSPYVYETTGNFEQSIFKLVDDYYVSEPQILKLLSFVKNPPYQKFYTADFIRQKLSEPQLEKFTPIDESLEQLLKFAKRMEETLPTFSEQTTCDAIRRAFLEKDVEFLYDVHDWSNQWQRALESLREKTTVDLTAIDWTNSLFGISIKRMEQIEEAISIFFDAAAEAYSKVYIIETNALLHYPPLLDDFTSNRAMLIVPKETMEYLNDLAESDDTKIQHNAKKALKTIDKYRNEYWLNLNEDTHEELLAEKEPDKIDGIFSIALKYIVKNPVIVTDDNDLKDVATIKNVETITAHELHEKLNEGSFSKGKTKNKAKRKKK